MSFLTGRTTFLRFKVVDHQPIGGVSLVGQDDLDKLASHAIGKQRLASADGIESGWTAGGDILDTDFTMEKNVIGDALFFSMRIDSNKLPADLLKAYYQADLRALIAGNPSGKPSLRQKREAKESARDRLEHEARDGRFLKRKAIECLWDRSTGELLFGATSQAQADRLAVLFKATFGATLELMTAERRAESLSGALDPQMGYNGKPSVFVASTPFMDVIWSLNTHDFLGNEFLLWLWYRADVVNDTIRLDDGTDATVMFSGGLKLECPRGQTGNDTFNHEGPTRLPEARRAVQSGKLPRKAGLIIVRSGEQFGLTLHAETMGIGSALLPKLEEEGDTARRFERIGHVRSLIEVLDLLYGEFCRCRFSGEWGTELESMQRWLSRSNEWREAA